VPQPQAPDSGAWARGDITLRGLIAGMGDEPALWIDQLDLPGGGFTVLTGASGAGAGTGTTGSTGAGAATGTTGSTGAGAGTGTTGSTGTGASSTTSPTG